MKRIGCLVVFIIHLSAMHAQGIVSSGVVPAQFPGGQSAMLDFLRIQKRGYSEGLVKEEVTVQFVVDKEGNIDQSSLKIVRGIPQCKDCEEEAIRIAKLMPRWQPAMKDGDYVEEIGVLSIEFHLKPDFSLYCTGGEPEYPGGRKAMIQFLKENLKYLSVDCAEGRVILRFVIDEEGYIDHSSIQVIRAMADCPECAEEAIRAVKLMPKWTPLKENGKFVRFIFDLPIRFGV